jgi:hypothetical protein
MKRPLRTALLWLTLIATTPIVGILIFYAEEDWRGARDWAACQRDLASKGEILDLRQLIPPGNSADDLSKVPIFAELYQEDTGEKARIHKLRSNLDSDNISKTPKTEYRKNQPVDLADWQKFYLAEPKSHLSEAGATPAQDVLKVLSQFDPELNEIDAAVSNPNAYFPVDYKMPFGSPLSGVTSLITVAPIVHLKGVAHLENKEVDLAEKDYLFSFRLCQPLTKGCFTVHYLVMAAIRTIDDAILWEGLRRHVWNDSQLHEMESALTSNDMLALAAQTLRNERGAFLQVVDVAQARDTDFSRRNSPARMALPFVSATLRPLGWWNQDRCTYSWGIQRDIEGLDLGQQTLSVSSFLHGEIPRSGKDNNPTPWSEFYVPLSAASLPGLDNFGPAIARAETYRRLARLACRLEECRLVHGAYPDQLDELPDLPAHLNQEVLSEQPFHYQRKGDGYLLYSLGWNQKDDAGTYSSDPKEGDWPWPSP